MIDVKLTARSVRSRRLLVGSTVLALAVLATPAAGLQTSATPGAGADEVKEKVLVLEFQTLNRSVNDASGEELSRVATDAARMFRERLREDGRYRLVTMEEFRDARSRLRRSESSKCAASACAREAARAVGVQHVFRGRVIKVSNLIWYLVIEHADVASGEVLGHESIELKGQRDAILPRAVAALHRWLLPAG